MLSKDWFDTLVVVAWVGVWSALIYLLPFAGV
ncbi:putative membrane protein [Vibrio mimicus]|nr:putative membrane protein [Vibrio mimicus]